MFRETFDFSSGIRQTMHDLERKDLNNKKGAGKSVSIAKVFFLQRAKNTKGVKMNQSVPFENFSETFSQKFAEVLRDLRNRTSLF